MRFGVIHSGRGRSVRWLSRGAARPLKYGMRDGWAKEVKGGRGRKGRQQTNSHFSHTEKLATRRKAGLSRKGLGKVGCSSSEGGTSFTVREAAEGGEGAARKARSNGALWDTSGCARPQALKMCWKSDGLCCVLAIFWMSAVESRLFSK